MFMFVVRFSLFSTLAEKRLAIGLTDNFIRMSIGIENEADIIADITQALDACVADYEKLPKK